MDFRRGNHEPGLISRGRKSTRKLGAISKTQRVSSRQQEVLLHSENPGEKEVSSTGNISVWKPERRRDIPEIPALFGCDSVVYGDHI